MINSIKISPDSRSAILSIRGLQRKTGRAINVALSQAARPLVNEARRTINEDTKTGVLYTWTHPVFGYQIIHRASASGESPANFTGALAFSIGARPQNGQLVFGAGGRESIVVSMSPDNIPSYVTEGQMGFSNIVNYAKKLEEDMNRPFLKPTMLSKSNVIKGYLETVIMDALKGTK